MSNRPAAPAPPPARGRSVAPPARAERAANDAPGDGDTLARVTAAYTIAPLAAVAGNVATVLGESLLTLLAMFYPLPLCKKANIVVTELVQNILENIADPSSEMRVTVAVDPARLVVEATNRVTPEQHVAVAQRVAELGGDPVTVRRRFAATIRARRAAGLKGGLGLMRLATENKFALTTRFEEDHLTVRAEYLLRGIE